MQIFSEKTQAHLRYIKSPVKEFKTVKFEKGGGEATYEIGFREADLVSDEAVRRRIESCIGLGVGYEILDEKDKVVDKVERDPDSMATHNEALTGHKTEIATCGECGRQFKSAHGLKIHMNTHG